jgi:hypothetical protein
MIGRCLQALHTEQTITAPYGSDLTLNKRSRLQMIVEAAAFAVQWKDLERFGKFWKDLERFGKIDDSSKKPTDDSFLNSYVDLV